MNTTSTQPPPTQPPPTVPDTSAAASATASTSAPHTTLSAPSRGSIDVAYHTSSGSGLKSFDTTSAIAGLYLWLLFGFFTSLLGCDLQRIMTKNIFVKHLMALVTFFFLMSVVDTDNNISVAMTWVKTILVYILFMISIKSKIISSAIFLGLLLADQTLKVEISYLQNNNPSANAKKIALYKAIRYYLLFALIIVAVIGFLFYFLKQYSDHYDEFSFIVFFFGNNHCNDL